MVIATSSAEGGATARTVVLQSASAEAGLMFGSNRESLKAQQARADGRVEAVLRFGQRQVRVRGQLSLDDAKTEDSFRRVHPAARVGLAALQQGREIDEHHYAELLKRVEADLRGPERDVPPPSYVAFVLRPRSFEFYNGGNPSYCNDRFLYVRRDHDSGFLPPIRLQA